MPPFMGQQFIYGHQFGPKSRALIRGRPNREGWGFSDALFCLAQLAPAPQIEGALLASGPAHRVEFLREPGACTTVEGMDQMAQIDNRYGGRMGARTDVAVDEGLRAYMLRVYNYMTAGVALTGVVAYMIFSYAVT